MYISVFAKEPHHVGKYATSQKFGRFFSIFPACYTADAHWRHQYMTRIWRLDVANVLCYIRRVAILTRWDTLCGFCMFSLCLLGFSGFLQQSNNMHTRLIGSSKLSIGENVSANGCLSRCLQLTPRDPKLRYKRAQEKNEWVAILDNLKYNTSLCSSMVLSHNLQCK